MKCAVVGAGGQHGSYMCDLLLSEGHEVHACVRPRTTGAWSNLEAAVEAGARVKLMDIESLETIHRLATGGYDEIYWFAAMTHIEHSFRNPLLALETNATAPTMMMEALRHWNPMTRFYFAGTSEMLPTTTSGWQDEQGQLGARSPYAAAKVAAYLMAQVYRQAFSLPVVVGITFNSESPRRGPSFVTQKICQGVASFAQGGDPVVLANLTAKRDWHHAKDTVRGIRAAMLHGGDTFVFASGESRSVGEWAQQVCDYFKVPLERAVKVDDKLSRPLDVAYLCGNPAKAESLLGWVRQYNFYDIVHEMCEAAGARLSRY